MTVQPGILEDYIARYSRWGQWGPDDQLGAMNLVGRSRSGPRRHWSAPGRSSP
jgi:hypothetical protein